MKKLGTLRLLVLITVLGALLVTAFAFMIFTRHEVTTSMLSAGDEEAVNVLRVIKLNIGNQYEDLQFFRRYALRRYQDQSRNLISLVISQIDYFHELSRRGILTEEEARRAALESVQRLRYGKHDYFFIYDANDVAISHPDPKVRGRNMSASRDVKGNPVQKIMREMTRHRPDGFCTMYWPKLGGTKPFPKLLYFRLYPEWNWLVGTGVYIDDIDGDTEKKMGNMMALLRRTIGEVKVADTGYFTLFNGKKKILIHPSLSGTDGSRLGENAMGADSLDKLMKAARDPSVPLKYLWDKPDHPGQYRFLKYSHVERFAPLDWFITSSVYQDEMERPAKIIIGRQIIFMIIFLLFCMLAVYLLLSRVTGPLAKLTRHAEHLRRSDFVITDEGSGELLSIRFPQEVSRLARTMWNMEGRLSEYLKTLRETTAARERMESELRIAREIQMSMLPVLKTALEGRTDIDLAAVLEPAREVGGDLYDFFFIDEQHLCLLVGDVSDKGVPAALFMARSKGLLRSIAMREESAPDRIFSAVNRELLESNETRMFITAFLGILNVQTGDLIFSNAGHVPPLLIAAAGSCETVALPPGKPLGISRESVYASRHLQLNVNDRLLVFTDGISEAMDTRGEFYGEERLAAALQGHQDLVTAKDVVEAVLREIRAFSERVPQFDDIAVVCLRRKCDEKDRNTGQRDGINLERK